MASSTLQPADQLTIRRNNLALVLRTLHDDGPLSRAAVASATGLNKATVSRLVTELIERGLVHELGTVNSRRRGRPATLIAIDGRRVAALGIELNVDFITCVAVDLGARPIYERTVAIDGAGMAPDRTLRVLATEMWRALDAVAQECTTLAGVTVAVPALVDVERSVVKVAPNLHWQDLEVGQKLERALGAAVTVSVDNDANLGALAEYRVGEFAGTPNLIYIAGQIGVGGGVVVDGRVLRGATGFSGEVGHMHVVDGGPLCGCGRLGCWEALVGLRPLLRAAVPDVLESLDAQPRLGPHEKVSHVVARAEAGDRVALHALEQHGRWLGTGLATLVNLFNPQVVVLGGIFRDIAPWMLEVAERTMIELSIAPRAGGCQLALSQLASSPAALGAAMHAAERVFDDPATVEAVISDGARAMNGEVHAVSARLRARS